MNINVNISAVGQLFLGLYLLLVGLVYYTDLQLSSWVLPCLALVAGIITLIGVVSGTFTITRKQ